jgi:hypothetical protein
MRYYQVVDKPQQRGVNRMFTGLACIIIALAAAFLLKDIYLS